MASTLAPATAPDNYSAPVRIAYENAARRIGDLSAESLHQFVHGRVKAPQRLAILEEELVKLGCFEQAQALVSPQMDALEAGPAEDFFKVLPIAESADAIEDCRQTDFLITKSPEDLRRFLSENDDAITKAIRLRRAGYLLLAQMKGEA